MKFCQFAPSAEKVKSVRYQLQRVRIIRPEFSPLGMHLVADPEPPRHEVVKIKRGIFIDRTYLHDLNSWVVRHNSNLEDRNLRLGGGKKQFLRTSIGIHKPSTWRVPTLATMTASIVSSTLGVTATRWGTLDVDVPRTRLT